MLNRVCLVLAAFALASMAQAEPRSWKSEWPETDFSRTSVENWSEIISGGPPRDGIPALTDPDMVPAREEARLDPREPVMTLELGNGARAYSVRYLMWHEIANDVVAGQPVAVTYCPLCNTAMVFDRRVGDRVLEFGVSGKLRFSDMIMYDRQTESWWQQALGTAIVGEMTGTQLTQLPAVMESWGDFLDRHPDGLVMDQPRTARQYGMNPYRGYDGSARPFLYRGENPPHGIEPLARVVRVGNRAWPIGRLRAAGEIREAGLVLRWQAGQASALDTAEIAQGRDVGTVRVTDDTGQPVVHDMPFAFAFHAFHPDGDWMLGD
ncbi:DUF3179 domain-containing protein [Lutimaribacter sp. EGI FJ00015]|uniref:DUF3179 domain-containing protein n=1 Tax=Lutimaribacter degradans TaxID=2945989 RepID=A0ACC5ZUJ6_9RHOB|nr:DUF3179 domain-containing protein [Lutimaribacter sp. EGI FJ00013]MCM2561059.1 DUF3179 domain-containing protein [Lutimaribacter sp. EGI FJ00013]MCO0611993.1 DUF3179 domain-containing protein [Lutimaribacter sp. EGI FJ00015]MCO0634887.1 DUF3179 domain-containing protein [Lutimaribacter sp. EGI FJ00014]